MLEEAAKPGAEPHAAAAEDRRLLRRLHGRSRRRESRRAPLQPALAAIGALKVPAELPPLLARMHLDRRRRSCSTSAPTRTSPIPTRSSPLPRRRTRPARPRLLRQDRREVAGDPRQICGHVARMLELLGDIPRPRRRRGADRDGDRDRAGKGSLTRVDKRDPYKLFHKMTRSQFRDQTPSFGWDRVLEHRRATRRSQINVTEPEFYKEVERQLKSQHLPTGRPTSAGTWPAPRRPTFPRAFVQARFRLLQQDLRGVPNCSRAGNAACSRWTAIWVKPSARSSSRRPSAPTSRSGRST